MRHNNDWSMNFSYEGFEETNEKEDILSQAHEALNRFYQKETRRSKTAKQKKHCWQ